MTVRRATAEDAALLAALNLHLQAWHAAHYPDVFLAEPDPLAVRAWFAERLADPSVAAFLVGDLPQGYALCSFQVRAANAFSPAVSRLMVDHIAVVPGARRKGHGSALMAAARALARDLGVNEILLDTWADNTEAHAFFRAQGFAPRRMLFQALP